MKILPLALLAALAGCHSNGQDDDRDGDAATMEVATAELPAIRYYMIADT